jgi:6-pyruvoyl-tetrahydropterin synthase
MASQIKKGLICLWKGCDEGMFEDADALQEHVIKHVQEQMQTNLHNQQNDGTEEQLEEDELLVKKAKMNEEKMTNGADIGER